MQRGFLLIGPRNFRFVICGSGEKLEYYKKKGAGCSNVLFQGVGEQNGYMVLNENLLNGISSIREQGKLHFESSK